MKKVLLILLLAAGSRTGFAQQDSSIARKDSIPGTSDTIRVGGIIIIKKPGDNASYDVKKADKYDSYKNRRKSNIRTNWLVIDVGFAGYNDRTDFSTQEAQDFLRFQNGVPASKGDYSLRTGRISNFNLYFFMQTVNLYKHTVNLKYGFGIETNNYFYKTPITYVDGADVFTFRDSVSFSRNKIAADFFSIPLMININTNPNGRRGGFQFSFGVSGQYLYNARQKQVSGERGKQKQRTGFNINKWKAAWVGELGLGPVRFYGSYSMTPLHDFGLDQFPYQVGIRITLIGNNW
jgi:hypothetical protein